MSSVKATNQKDTEDLFSDEDFVFKEIETSSKIENIGE
jgi:hypothetical protein